MANLPRKIIYGIIFAIVVYLIYSIWGSAHGLGAAFLAFKWKYLPLLLFLSILNYLSRFIKWQYYLKVLKIKIPLNDSFIIYFSGLALSITPGKLGEVVKSYFLKKGFNESASKTAPIVLADRLTDFFALIILTAIGVIDFSYGQKIIWMVAIILVFFLLVIIIKPIGQNLIIFLTRLKFLNSRTKSLNLLYSSSYILLSPRVFLFPLFVSLVAWSFEALAFYFLFLVLGIGGGFLIPFFIYCFSTIVGAASLLPGGLGVTEGTITGLMRILNIDIGLSTLATLLIRATTLWFGVIIGTVFLLIAEKRYNQQGKEQKKGKIKLLFHIHTKKSSDGWLEYQAIIDFCRKSDIKVVAITDHNEISGAIELEKLADGNPRVIIGEEIKTPDGEIIGLFLTKKIAKFTPLKKAISEIKKQGGLVCLPHPGDKIRRTAVSPGAAEKIINEVDIVESYNSRNLLKTSDCFGKYLAEKYQKASVAGADAHLPIELGSAINVIGDFKDRNDFLYALNNLEYNGRKTGIFIQVITIILKKLKRK